jgi:hypothetical protein
LRVCDKQEEIMRNFIMAAVAAACLAGAGTAQAQYIIRDGQVWSVPWGRTITHSRYDCSVLNSVPSFGRLDRNYDGRISSWEARRVGLSWREFNRLDLNGNGVVSRGEMRVYQRNCY